jgi:hypothetical protein
MWRSSHPARPVNFSRGANFLILPILLILPIVSAVLAAAPSRHVHFSPKFFEGETLRYQVEMRTVSTGNTTTPIANPEGETKVSQTISLLVRLDVIGTAENGVPASGQSRLRATYEQSRAQSESDAFNPDAPSLDDQYTKLEQRSIEFTLMPDGHLTNITGLEDVFPIRSETDPILSWVQALSTGSRLPPNGIALGQKWSSERSLAGWPLTGLSWRTESTYLRDDVCSRASAAIAQQPDANAGDAECAILLTHFEILHRGSADADSTPEEYRRNGLRTSGAWKGSGESLDTISLATGLLESSTQTSTQNMDYQITSPSAGSRIHHVGQVQSESHIRLVSGPSLRP